MESLNISMENSLFSIPLLVGFIFALVGSLMYQFPPQDINPLVGYRTKNSMKSQERWDFAQKYSSKLMIYLGTGLMFLSVIGLVVNIDESTGGFISMGEILLVIIILIYKTESAIKQKFGK